MTLTNEQIEALAKRLECVAGIDRSFRGPSGGGTEQEAAAALRQLAAERSKREWESYINGIVFITNQRPPSSRTHDGANTLNELRKIGDDARATAARLAADKMEKP